MSVRTPEVRNVAGLHTTIWPGSASPVVALPGLGSTSAAWTPLATQLSGTQLIAPDLRGRGKSVEVKGTPGLRGHARDVASLMAELELTDVTVVGHSMGAYLAPVVAQEAGKRVRKLVLIDGGIPPALPWIARHPALTRATFRRQLTQHNREWPDVESFARKAKFERMIASRPDLRETLMTMLHDELGGGDGPLRPRVNIDYAVADAVDVFFGPDVPAALEALSVPAEVLLAENMKWDGQKPFISDKAVSAWTGRQPLLNVSRLKGNHVTVLFAPEVAAAITG